VADLSPVAIAEEFLRGLRLATLAIMTVVLCLWFTPIALTSAAAYRSVPLESAALAVLVVINAIVAVVVLRERPWGRLRWPLLGTALAATLVATSAVHTADLITAPHWSWKIFGWFAVLLLMDLRLRWFFAALAAQQAVNAVQVIAMGAATPALVEMGVTGLLVASWQSAVTLAVVELRRSAGVARQISAEEERLRTSERVAEQLHDDRQARYADLTTSTAPLLAGLASGELHPADPLVQRACLIEAARMRRLFAESDDVPDPLEHEIHACVDVAERQGTSVQLSIRGARPALPLDVRRALTEPVIAVLAGARSRARVTVVGVNDQVTLSVIADGARDAREPAQADGDRQGPGGTPGRVRTTRLVRDDQLWLEVTWEPAA
jgi:hypothetical protein